MEQSIRVNQQARQAGRRKRPSPLMEWKRLAGELASRDKHLRPLIQKIGSPALEFQPNKFRALVESILSQQLAPKAADAIITRFRALSPPFPDPEEILRWRVTKVTSVGVSRAKASYLHSLSEAWSDKNWRSGWGNLTDEALVERLIQVKGIGQWTAHMFLIFSQGRPDILPVGDYGIQRALQILLAQKTLPKPKEIPGLVPHWKGASSVASWYLWRSLDLKLLV